ncbi:hypothetical protein [Lentzea jiangxiensis]|uniref:hypothetical protein n=1 Tax=Lentzea jiangxiensis TaxID=641025 RepID=UPI0015A13493|nr:hypothetical protein [Lentzea jiangxiensis]
MLGFVPAAFERGTRRDAELLGGLRQARRAFEQRHHAASNADVANPVLVELPAREA